MIRGRAYQVEHFVVVSLRLGAVAADRRHVNHAISELNKSASLDGQVEVRDVVQAEVDQRLDVLLAQVAAEAVLSDQLAVLVGHQPILGEAIVHLVDDVLPHLLLLLGQVGAPDDAHHHLGSQLGEEGLHGLVGLLAGLGEGAVDVEEHEDAVVPGHGIRNKWM